jgi:hypothetical protein
MQEFMFEASTADPILEFVQANGKAGKPRAASIDVSGLPKTAGLPESPLDSPRNAMPLPKEHRPPQPASERAHFERLWEENFARSEVARAQADRMQTQQTGEM